MLLGCIADDLTGATDLALMLTRSGFRTVQVTQIPESGSGLDEYDAVVVALKSRTIAADQAVALSLRSAEFLLRHGARQLFFKYCSTFDSTDAGNIGPVADALMARLGADMAIACPAFPTNQRTIYQGNLFVGGVPLAESSMKDHPLTPMRDSNLVRVLQRQTSRKVGLVPFETVAQGAAQIGSRLAALAQSGCSYAIVDALTDEHLVAIGSAVAEARLVTGGSGVALGLPANFQRAGLTQAKPAPRTMQAKPGRAAILAGSCSEATRGQIRAALAAGVPAYQVDPFDLAADKIAPSDAVSWARSQPPDRPVLIYSSADPETVARVQAELGREHAGQLVESFLAQVATGLTSSAFTRLIVAGGETSGAVVGALKIGTLEIGPEIDPGVPWTRALDGAELVLALKSGNFGAADFFLKAWERLT
jgi:3-dehydrotetronate 4-kinase